ncbi:MAG: translation initiation factor IF-3 [bacterium]|nr:translation initiation factor IF-3 [bacterium]
MAREELRINERIRANEVRLIDEAGQPLGIVALSQAMNMAVERGLDLVEISGQSTPPVCKIMDYSKYRYEQEKKEKKARKSHKVIHVKEIKIRPKIGTHDLEVKLRHTEEFLAEGDKVKIAMMFRGREMAHMELGVGIMRKIEERFATTATIEQSPKMEGNTMFMLLGPAKK